jgi:hypothetical protein
MRLPLRILNGLNLEARGCFVWLNAWGFGIGRLDPEGLGRRQYVVYWNTKKLG